MILKLIKV